MKIFVFTDNRFVYHKLLPILLAQEVTEVDFYCSPSSAEIFFEEIAHGEIRCALVNSDLPLLLEYQLGFSCHSKQIFPAELVNDVRCINIHPGMNPYNRGWYSQVFSIQNKHPAGVTIHEMDKEIDHGPIICQSQVKIQDWETSANVYMRVLEQEVELFSKWAPRLISGDYQTRQPEVEGNFNSKQDFLDLCEIDLDKSVTFREAIDYLRAVSHPPFFNAYYRSGELKVYVRLELWREIIDDDT